MRNCEVCGKPSKTLYYISETLVCSKPKCRQEVRTDGKDRRKSESSNSDPIYGKTRTRVFMAREFGFNSLVVLMEAQKRTRGMNVRLRKKIFHIDDPK